MTLKFTVAIECDIQHIAGKFASKDELIDKVIESIRENEPCQIETDDEATYEVTSWEVSEPIAVRYFVKEDGMTAADPYTCQTCWSWKDPNYIAEDCADDFHSHHDGTVNDWPLILTLIMEDGSEKDYEVERDISPSFRAYAKP